MKTKSIEEAKFMFSELLDAPMEEVNQVLEKDSSSPWFLSTIFLTEKLGFIEGEIWLEGDRADIDDQGVKLHIPVQYTDVQESLKALNFIKEVHSKGIPLKVCFSPRYLEQYETQKNKHIVLYPNNLNFIRELSKESFEFLSEYNGLDILNEHHFGGKLFGRWSGFCVDEYYDFTQKRIVTSVRGENSFPSFVSRYGLLNLEQIRTFKGNKHPFFVRIKNLLKRKGIKFPN